MRTLTLLTLLLPSLSACSLSIGAKTSVPVPAAVVGVKAEGRTFFGIPLEGARDVIFVLDRSGSMGGINANLRDFLTGTILSAVGLPAGDSKASKLDIAKGELIRALGELADGTTFNVVFFDDNVAVFAPAMVTLDAASRAAAVDFIKAVGPGGSTAEVAALRQAYAQSPARVILLSDGLANVGGGADVVLAEARAQFQRGLRMDTVGVGADKNSPLLTTLAAEGKGVAVLH